MISDDICSGCVQTCVEMLEAADDQEMMYDVQSFVQILSLGNIVYCIICNWSLGIIFNINIININH